MWLKTAALYGCKTQSLLRYKSPSNLSALSPRWNQMQKISGRWNSNESMCLCFFVSFSIFVAKSAVEPRSRRTMSHAPYDGIYRNQWIEAPLWCLRWQTQFLRNLFNNCTAIMGFYSGHIQMFGIKPFAILMVNIERWFASRIRRQNFKECSMIEELTHLQEHWKIDLCTYSHVISKVSKSNIFSYFNGFRNIRFHSWRPTRAIMRVILNFSTFIV